MSRRITSVQVRRWVRAVAIAAAVLVVGVGCSSASPTDSTATGIPASSPAAAGTGTPKGDKPFAITPTATFERPWAMTFLPGGTALITDRGGTLWRVEPTTGAKTEVTGVPQVVVDGQGGLGDIMASPTFATDRRVYLTWVESGPGGTGAVLGRGVLTDGATPRLDGVEVLWRQEPKTSGSGHFAHRLAFSPDGHYLFLTSGDRQKLDPAQDLGVNLGKVLRLTLDGQAAPGNPFADRGGVSTQIWSYGHRNPLGIAFDPAGNLWISEMGPQGGDEINLVLPGRNYGWPLASNGSQYGGADIPDHRPGDGFEAPRVWWTPSISPGSLMIYTGMAFPQWRGDAFVGALSGQALWRVHLDGTTATKADEWPMGARIREVEQGPDGTIWLLEDGPNGRLLHLTP